MRWPWRLWSFGEAIAVRALRVAGENYPWSGGMEYVVSLMYAWAGRSAAPKHADHVAPGRELIACAAHTADEFLLDAAVDLGRFLVDIPKGKAGIRYHRPDLAGWSTQIWVDCLDHEPPFLVRLGVLTGEERFIDGGVEQVLGYSRLLQDEASGLFCHGYDAYAGVNGDYWARGNGWAVLGLVGVLEHLPPSHPDRTELLERLSGLFHGLNESQDESGLWPTLLIGPQGPLESTLAAMTAIAARQASDLGLVQERWMESMEQRARRAVIERINEKGELQLVSSATPVGSRDTYITRPFGVYPWGQGPALMLCSQ